MEDIKVSILCTTYNHEKYIKNCLDGFVMQETDFDFEIIVHDDASTDNTADIIRKYEMMYPNLFKVIYQTENQYSKGVKITKELLFPLAKGKYIALCEGDDYWCDREKLQKQVDALDNNPDCSLSVCGVEMISESGDKMNRFIPNRKFEETISINDVGKYYPVPAFQTSSYVIKRNVLNEIFFGKYKDITACCPVGDLNYLYLSLLDGNACYINNTMSCYRVASNGSWNERKSQNKNYSLNFYDKMIDYSNMLLKLVDNNCEFAKHIHFAIDSYPLKKALVVDDYKEICSLKNRKYAKSLFTIKERLYFLYKYFVSIVRG